jgi:predicted class III extradiol MEMO1 family dioxygenase
MHLPYLKHILGDNFKVVPIIVGHLSPEKALALG